MVQPPLTTYISNGTTLAVYGDPWHFGTSSTPSNADHIVIKSILGFFRSLKRKHGGNPPSFENNFKFIACFSNPPPNEPPPPGFSDSSEGLDTQVHEHDKVKIERNISDSSKDDDSYDSPTEIEVTSASNDSEEINLDLFRSQSKEIENATFNSMRSLPRSHIHVLSPFVVKIRKVVSNPGGLVPTNLTRDVRRKLEILRLSLDNTHKSIFKKEAQKEIWERPILMGRRCRKLDDNFPYGDDPPSSNGSKIDGENELP